MSLKSPKKRVRFVDVPEEIPLGKYSRPNAGDEDDIDTLFLRNELSVTSIDGGPSRERSRESPQRGRGGRRRRNNLAEESELDAAIPSAGTHDTNLRDIHDGRLENDRDGGDRGYGIEQQRQEERGGDGEARDEGGAGGEACGDVDDMQEVDGERVEGKNEGWSFANADWNVSQPAEADDPVEAFNDAGIPLEPFNLKREREEGYFDPVTGSYIAYLDRKGLEEIEDAWADSLPRDQRELEAWWKEETRSSRGRASDSSFVVDREKSKERVAIDASNGEDGFQNIADVDRVKQQIADLLNPGESVLGALRRLGSLRLGSLPTRRTDDAPSSLRGDDAGDSFSQRRQEPSTLSQPRKAFGPGISTLHKSRLPIEPEAKDEFDSLTRMSDQLVKAGIYDVHHMSREDLLSKCCDSGEALPRSKGDVEGSHHQLLKNDSSDKAIHAMEHQEAVMDIDMFASVEDPVSEEMGAMPPTLSTGEANSNHSTIDTGLLTLHQVQNSREERRRSRKDNISSEAVVASRSMTDAEEGSRAQSHQLQEMLQGFLPVENSEYLYNSAMQAYYCCRSELFGDVKTGKWYKVDPKTGQFVQQ